MKYKNISSLQLTEAGLGLGKRKTKQHNKAQNHNEI